MGGADGPQGSGVPALVEVVFGNGLGLSGIELRALVEVVGEGFLGGLFCFPTGARHVELGLGWPPGWMKERGRRGLPDMGQDLCDGLRLGEERDECEGCLAGWADEGEDLVDASQEGGPLGRTGGGGIRCPPFCPLWLGRWDRVGFREGKPGTRGLSREGIILLGPGGDQRPQGRIGCEDPVVAVAVDSGRGKDGG